MTRLLWMLGVGATMVILGACSRQDDLSLKHITAARLKERIAVLAHDSMEGRAPGTRGEERALAYITVQYRELGLEPADELRDDWNYDGAIQRAEFALQLARWLANEAAIPVWNNGDEFETAGLRTRSGQQNRREGKKNPGIFQGFFHVIHTQ